MKKNHLFKPRMILFALLIVVLTTAVLTPQLTFAGPLSAVDDANTVVLLHMDGAENSTQIIDESGKVWVPVGAAHITGAASKFNQSLNLGATDALLALDTDDVYFGSGDFTIDFWVMFSAAVPAGSTVTLFSQQPDSGSFMNITRSSTTWYFTVTSASSSVMQLSVTRAVSTGAWMHIAVVRNGNIFRMFENGTQIGTTTDADSLPNFAAPVYIGSAAGNSIRGYLDEFRISRIARWTSDFIPPAAPYEAPTPTPTSTPTLTFTPTLTAAPTYTLTPSVTPTGTLPTSTVTVTPNLAVTSTLIPGSLIVITVPVSVSLNESNTNTNTGGGSSTGTGGSFSAVTPVPLQQQGGVSVFGGLSCGGYYIRVRVYVDDNQDKMMSPAEGITGLQVFFLDQTYSRLGSTYSVDGKADFCIPVTHYGKTIQIDIPYLQLFGQVQVPDQPNQDLEIWFPGQPPTLPLYLP